MRFAGASRALAAIAVLATLSLGGRLAGAAATAATETAVRSADHPGFGRIVIDTDAATEYTVKQDGDHVVVHLPDNVALGAPPAQPRNVVGLKVEGSTVDLMLRPGARLRASRLGGRVILDLVDDGGAAAPLVPTKTAPELEPNKPKA